MRSKIGDIIAVESSTELHKTRMEVIDEGDSLVEADYAFGSYALAVTPDGELHLVYEAMHNPNWYFRSSYETNDRARYVK